MSVLSEDYIVPQGVMRRHNQSGGGGGHHQGYNSVHTGYQKPESTGYEQGYIKHQPKTIGPTKKPGKIVVDCNKL